MFTSRRVRQAEYLGSIGEEKMHDLCGKPSIVETI
jgi:hypothetical protein